MRYPILVPIIALLVVLGFLVVILWRRMAAMRDRMERTARQRATTLAEVRQALRSERSTDDEAEVPEPRRHLRVVPVIAAAATVGAWAKTYPLPAALSGAAVTVASLAVLVTTAVSDQESTSIDALPYMTTTAAPSPSVPDGTTSANPTTVTSKPVRVAIPDRVAPTRRSGQPSQPPPSMSVSATTPPASSAEEPGEDDRAPAPGCLVQVDALGIINICVPTLPPMPLL